MPSSSATPHVLLQRQSNEVSPDESRSPSPTNDDKGEKAGDNDEQVEVRAAPSNDVESLALSEGVGAVGYDWRYKGPALLCIIFFTMGSNFADSSLSPLKSTMKKEISGLTNARYGTLASADSLINTVLPILSGIAIDYYGPSYGSLVSSTAILIGTIVRAIGGNIGSFSLILVGQIIFGLGSTTIETAQSKLYSHWFRGTVKGGPGYMGFIYGLDIAMGRVFNLMGRLTAVPIAEASGKWYWSFWVGAILCGATLAVNVAYVTLERRMPAEMHVMTGRKLAKLAEDERLSKSEKEEGTMAPSRRSPFSRETFVFISLSIVAIPAAFWVVTISQLLQAGTVNAYSSNLAEMVEVTRGTSALTAGYTSAIGQVIPIVLTPLWGLLFDVVGHRMSFVSATATLWIMVFALLGFSDVHPLCPVIFGSLALSSNAVPFIASIPLLAPSQAVIGTAFGIWKAFNSAGSTIMDVSTGAIQDRTPTGPNQFNNVFYLLIALKAVDVLYGLCYYYLDARYFGSVLRMSEKARIAKQANETAAEKRQGLRAPSRLWTIGGCVVALAAIITSYTLYITYSFGT